MNEIYLDNAATTIPYNQSIEVFNDTVKTYYANPSSIHNLGFKAEDNMNKSLDVIADILHCKRSELILTSCGSESNNIILQGVARANIKNGKHLVTSKIEHPSVLNVFKALEIEGFEVTYLDVDANGLVDLEQLKSSLRNDTILVSIMHINNEIGSIQPIKDIVNIVKTFNKNITVHSDMVQSFGKEIINLNELKLDSISISAHKFHGLRGAGLLYLKEGTKINIILHGGGQQYNLRPGTENIASLASMAKASYISYSNIDKDSQDVFNLKKYFIEKLKILKDETNTDIKLNISKENNLDTNLSTPFILSVSILGLGSEVIIHALEEYGIYASAGSACSAHSKHVSDTLQAIKIPKDQIDSTIRFSFSKGNTLEQIDYTIDKLKDIINKYKMFIRK